MFDPVPKLPDTTLIEMVRFPAIIRNALIAGGLKSIGEIRASPDSELGRMMRIGKESLAYLRKALGARSGRTRGSRGGLKAKGK
jgi:hypothetical protein